MKTLTLFLSVFAFLLVSNVDAQVRLTKGDFKALKGQKTIAVKFTYDNMAVGKYKNEAEYLKKRVAELNEKEAGRGDKWKESWINDRDTRFKPKFLDLITKYTEKKGPLLFSDDAEGTKYTMLINTDFLEPGFNAYVVKRNAETRMTIKLVMTDDPSKVVAQASVNGVGRTFGYGDLDTGTRIAEAYAKAGKDFAKYLTKKALK